MAQQSPLLFPSDVDSSFFLLNLLLILCFIAFALLAFYNPNVLLLSKSLSLIPQRFLSLILTAITTLDPLVISGQAKTCARVVYAEEAVAVQEGGLVYWQH